MHPIPLGLVHGRFQPPHGGHLRYILAALARAQRVLIGICTPKLCTEEEAARTGFPCTAALNPFSYDERAAMLDAALAEAGILPERYSFLPFPSDYVGMERVVPEGTVFLMSRTGPDDDRKAAYIRSLGYAAETVIEIPEGEEREHSAAVRESVRTGTDAWHSLVPPAVRAYMEKQGLLSKLR